MKRCISCNVLIDDKGKEDTKYGICDDCSFLMSKVLGADLNSRKEKCLNLINTVKNFIFPAIEKLKRLGLTQNTIQKTVLDPYFVSHNLKMCDKCGTFNMIFDKKVRLKSKKEKLIKRYQCTKCNHLLLEDEL